ncbi:8-oxo-dGDP phosphatase NUDT18-like [Gigantopelta aegis]|uniref:8-oxo-dGDP phosphatase NUDT18-like n=1 Tax=Gigantopelta aegis TaxID=1735272 RepID=UPI001B887EFE|nr:8-oxo-dGDP phosphatase NUDT18-like [Gigantopelta aegis]
MESTEWVWSLEASMKRLLCGQSVPIVGVDAVSEQAESIKLITKFNLCYIVAGVLFNEKDEVLMIQESKRSCYGEWYLPAGRVEPDENFKDAVIREVKEEAGLECEPSTLLSVEFGGGHWYRFTFTGKVTGGKLKTESEQDAESIQAKWVNPHEVRLRQLPLRCFDIVHLIDIGIRHRQLAPDERPLDLMPAIQSHDHMIMRCVIVHTASDGKLNILVNKGGNVHFPCASIAPRDFSSDVCIFRIFKIAFGQVGLSDCVPDVCGLLSVEHCGIPKGKHDGMCLTILVTVTSKSGNLLDVLTPDYAWCSLRDSDLLLDVKDRLAKQKIVTYINRH